MRTKGLSCDKPTSAGQSKIVASQSLGTRLLLLSDFSVGGKISKKNG